ncbi:MAG: ATP-binding cassette domain-containing protein, partial [Pseudomonadota bacterium]
GKTTMLMVVAGLITRISGHLENRFQRIGFAFQDSRLIPHLSARENVLLCCRSGGKARSLPGLDVAFGALDLSRQADQRAEALSGGEAQRVNLLRAVYLQPDLLILDEVGANVDEPNWALMADFIERSHADNPFAILQVAHHASRRVPSDDRLDLTFSK